VLQYWGTDVLRNHFHDDIWIASLENKLRKTEDDVVVDGRSTKELVKSVIQMENRVVEFIKLLVPTEGYTLENLTYEEIEDEWPLSVQLEIVSRIGDTIAPSYKEERKN